MTGKMPVDPDEVRHECYPALPAVEFADTCKARHARREAVDLRNARISEGGAQRAVDAAGGGSIGAAKKPAEPKP
jgi:hypothetical protein